MNITDINDDGIGLDGMDPVAHYNGEPMKGKAHLNYEIFGVKYLFATKDNIEEFQKDPEKFIPRTGAYVSGSHEKNKRHAKDADKRPHPDTQHFHNRKDLEDNIESRENNVPMDMKEDGDVEMQNLHDSEK